MPAESVMQLIYLNYFSWILQSWNKTVPNKWSFFPLMRYRVLFSFAAVFLSKLYSNGKGLWLWSSYFKKLENTENYINEKLGAEIQNRGEAAAPEKTTSITTTAQRGTGRAPVRRAGLAAASPRGLQGAGAEAGWRHQQRDPSSRWEQSQVRRRTVVRAVTGTDGDSSRDRWWLEAVTQPRENWRGRESHLDSLDRAFLNLRLGMSGSVRACFTCSVPRKHIRV